MKGCESYTHMVGRDMQVASYEREHGIIAEALYLHGVASEAGVELVDEGEHDDGVQARVLHERQLRLHERPTRHGSDKQCSLFKGEE